MSATTPVEFRGRGLWAFDVSLSILLAELIGIAEALSPHQRPPWLAGALPTLRVHTVVGADLQFSPDLDLEDSQLDELIALIAEATRRLRQRRTVTAAEAAEWRVLDNHAVLWRPADAVDTAPIAELGEALIQLLQGTLPSPPPGTWWYFGLSGVHGQWRCATQHPPTSKPRHSGQPEFSGMPAAKSLRRRIFVPVRTPCTNLRGVGAPHTRTEARALGRQPRGPAAQ